MRRTVEKNDVRDNMRPGADVAGCGSLLAALRRHEHRPKTVNRQDALGRVATPFPELRHSGASSPAGWVTID